MRLFVLSLLLVVAGSLAVPTWAADTTDPNQLSITPELTIIPGLFEAGKAFTITPTSIADYIRIIFIAFIWAVGVLATVMVIYGGVRWVAAAGDAGKIRDARSTIDNAIIGLIIALTSIVLLNVISPTLTKFQGIKAQQIDRLTLEFVTDIQKSVGEFTRCSKTKVSGEPSEIWSGPTAGAGPSEGKSVTNGKLEANSLINDAARKYTFTGIDPFALKAIMMIESQKTASGQFFSGPNLSGTSSSYGLGQFVIKTLIEVLTVVNPGGLPPGCKTETVTDNQWSQPHKQIYACDGKNLSQSCKYWLDKRDAGATGIGMSGIEAQVQMIANYYSQQLRDSNCIKGDLLLAAAAYNQGLHGASQSFCSPETVKDPAKAAAVKAAAIDYIAKFKEQYARACANGS
ncbi:MAG: hypothetical protein HY975_03305 [Candidatus Kerfeldbacteria bacterium]|nr:hypothetical protein [Candidatus Kerfeldbacteria bacterium]